MEEGDILLSSGPSFKIRPKWILWSTRLRHGWDGHTELGGEVLDSPCWLSSLPSCPISPERSSKPNRYVRTKLWQGNYHKEMCFNYLSWTKVEKPVICCVSFILDVPEGSDVFMYIVCWSLALLMLLAVCICNLETYQSLQFIWNLTSSWKKCLR